MTRPVDISEVKSYLRCRLSWFWSAPPPRGLGLEPRIPRTPLYYGRLSHMALQESYDTGVAPEDAFRTVYAREAAKLGSSIALFPEISNQLELGVAMMRGYTSWAEQKDVDTRFLATETEWEIQLGPRRLRGIFDAVIERPDGIWVLDFKTTSSSSTDWTVTDLQGTAYVKAARQLYGPMVRGIIFRFLLKKIPLPYDQLILKNGTLTQRQDLSKQTTYEEFTKAVAVATLQHLVKVDFVFARQVGLTYGAPLETYLELLDGTQQEKEWYPIFNEEYRKACQLCYAQSMELRGESRFFWDVEEYRSEVQLDNCFRYVVIPAIKEITSTRKGRWIGPTGLGTAFSSCGNCGFKDPCRLVMDGADYRTILRDEYQLRDAFRGDKEEDES